MIKIITAVAVMFVLFIWICWALGMIADELIDDYKDDKS